MDFPSVPFKTFTIYYQGQGQMDERAWASKSDAEPVYQMDERTWTNRVTSVFPNLNPVYYAPSDREVAECFGAVSCAYEVPMPSWIAVSAYFVFKTAAERKIRVLLDGQGADEYLAGYWPAYDRLIGGQIRRNQWLSALKSLCDCKRQRSLNLVGAGLLGLKSVRAAVLNEAAIWRRRSISEFSQVITDKRGSLDLPKFHGSPLSQYLHGSLFDIVLPSLVSRSSIG
jgi:asparagine synthetase B (glutamine-hydrolysing)